MANAINYAERYQTELDQTITQATLTSQLETPNVNWMGAKTFHVPNLSVTGYQDHSRNGGFNRGDGRRATPGARPRPGRSCARTPGR